MPRNYAKHYARKGPTPQTQAIPGREADMTVNSAGGVTFTVDDWARLDRFLILGSEAGSYYASAQKLSRANAGNMVNLIRQDGERFVDRIVAISDAGRAPKNDPALFALALAASADDVATRQHALAALPKVARIGTHLFHFADYVNSQRGWGRALKRSVGNWYNERSLGSLINQVIKYQQRDGWSNRDLLRLSHPATDDAIRIAIYNWMCGKAYDADAIPTSIRAFEDLKANPTVDKAVAAIESHDLPRECIPTELLNDARVWKALLKKMKMGALVRNLGKMSALDILKPLSDEARHVISLLENEDEIKSARLHPLAILIALKVYAQGRSMSDRGGKGQMTWTPNPKISDALDGAFYKAFESIEPTGKRHLLALDVSGSMGGAVIQNTGLTAREASGAMALVTAAVEPETHIVGFSSGRYSYGFSGKTRKSLAQKYQGLCEIPITPKMRMEKVIETISDLDFGGTDCALPMIYAKERGLKVDAFVVYTDNETWAGSMQPVEALRAYRKASGIDAKLVVVGMTANEFTIADPSDPGMLDVVGFDTAAPAVIADFIRG